MKVLIVNNYYQVKGGTDTYVSMLYNLLVKKGHDVFLYKEDNSSIRNFYDKIRVSFNLLFSNNEGLYKILNFYKPDICHINNFFPKINFSIIKICKEKEIPVIQTIHDFRYINLDGIYDKKIKTKNLVLRYFFDIFKKKYHNSYFSSLILALCLIKEKKWIENIDYYIFPNEFAKNVFRRYFNIGNKFSVVPHFVNFYQTENLKNDKKNFFIYIGRISEEKGVRDLIQVFESLPDLSLKVVGIGPLLSKLKRFRRSNIQFLGHISDDEKYKLLKEALFCVIPSKIEELGPLVLIESFMCGTPVIIPSFSSFKEKVENNKTGLFYKPNSILSLKKAIIKAKKLTRSNLYKKMTKFVRKKYFKNYHEAIYYQKLKEIYDYLLKK